MKEIENQSSSDRSTHPREVIYLQQHIHSGTWDMLVTFHTQFGDKIETDKLITESGVSVSNFLESQGITIQEAEEMFPGYIQSYVSYPNLSTEGAKKGKRKNLQKVPTWNDVSLRRCAIPTDEDSLKRLADRIGSSISFYTSSTSDIEVAFVLRVEPD